MSINTYIHISDFKVEHIVSLENEIKILCGREPDEIWYTTLRTLITTK